MAMPKNQNQPDRFSRRSTIALVSLIMAQGAAVQAQNSVTNMPPPVNAST
ncbi:MAG: hypothetical protein H7X97_11730, partial [Opitutaceae bacterium]|nr:hypothetical protein [Verrucomicrobiales bacterium]